MIPDDVARSSFANHRNVPDVLRVTRTVAEHIAGEGKKGISYKVGRKATTRESLCGR